MHVPFEQLIETLEDKSPKQLRTLRNNLNNRISALEAGNEGSLKPSHPLYGFGVDECKKLKKLVEVEIEKTRP
jgi:hypothetical protein